MFGHVKFGVSDYAASRAFFLKARASLGVSRQADALYRAALEAGGKDNGPPGVRPRDHANYCAAFVTGPDGHNIEAGCHEPEA